MLWIKNTTKLQSNNCYAYVKTLFYLLTDAILEAHNNDCVFVSFIRACAVTKLNHPTLCCMICIAGVHELIDYLVS